jgi:hypothetical protein
MESEHNIAREDKEVSGIGMESKLFSPEVFETRGCLLHRAQRVDQMSRIVEIRLARVKVDRDWFHGRLGCRRLGVSETALTTMNVLIAGHRDQSVGTNPDNLGQPSAKGVYGTNLRLESKPDLDE